MYIIEDASAQKILNIVQMLYNTRVFARQTAVLLRDERETTATKGKKEKKKRDVGVC